jgi:MoaA/NifB/PqqE/SkfB family radical SAM enzyme
MYIQITSRCNMSCEHCCNACTTEGEDMTPEVFAKALELSIEEDSQIELGGGEPTLHPHFWNFLIDSIASDARWVWLATNGSITKTALKLANLARKGVIGCALSQDYYHDSIDDKVVKAFTRSDSNARGSEAPTDGREIRDVIAGHRSYDGKWIEPILSPFRNPEDGGDPTHCPCPSVYIKPNGDIHACGCKNSPKIGDVFNGYEPLTNEDGDYVDCWQEAKGD